MIFYKSSITFLEILIEIRSPSFLVLSLLRINIVRLLFSYSSYAHQHHSSLTASASASPSIQPFSACPPAKSNSKDT